MTAMDDAALTEHVCQVLADAGLGWVYSQGAYTADQVGIFYGQAGPSPDRAVGVSVYATDDPRGGPARRWVQVYVRGAPHVRRGADAMAGDVFAVLHDRHHTGLVSRYIRVSSAPLGADDNGRQERADNYQIILSPTPLEAS